MNKLFRISSKRFFAIGFAVLLCLNFFVFSAVSDFEDRPDLEIIYVDFPDEIIEDKEVKFVVEIKNSINDETGEYGNISSADSIWVSLKVDNVRVSTDHYDSGLDVGESCYVNLTWDAEVGLTSERQILIEVDYTQDISESNENNNERPGVINVYEKDTELSIIDVVIPDVFIINNSYDIFASVKNDGSETSTKIVAFLNSSVEGSIEKLEFKGGLDRDEIHIFSFNWTPSKIGKQTLSINIIYSGKKHDSFSSSVFVGDFDWWNESWHYRYFVSVTGSGNLSKTFNFTSLLEELGVYHESFENETIRVVQYSSKGKIVDDFVNYSFNESSDYDPLNNANGSLLWNVVGSNEKFYCIYFDVDSNDGTRSYQPENQTMNVSGNAAVKYDGFVEGWRFEINNPDEEDYVFVNEVFNVSVNTDAVAENVEVYVFLNENESNNKTFHLSSIDGITWVNTTILDALGNWTFKIKCWDDAGFITLEKECTIFVGKPDLILSNVSLETSWPTTSPEVYINDTVYFTASVFCSFATVDFANVTLSVYNNEIIEIYSEVKNSTFEKDKYTNVSFEWDASIGGNFSFKFFVDSDNIIDESNESNNEKQVNITVYYWPDLTVTSIKWKKTTIMEYDKVEFIVKVKNIGLGDAKNYDLKLFIKPSSQKTLEYNDEVYTKKISINSGTEKEFSLFWNSSEGGKWFVAAKVFVSDAKKDANISNNGLFITDELVVRPIEKVKPVIKNVYASPMVQQQAGCVDIIADVTDDTGLESVFVSIYDSDDKLVETADMIRIAGDGFKYVFSGTLNIDTYTFVITAIDISINKNSKTYEGSFEIIRDQTSPAVSYVWADPIVQLMGKSTTVSCTAKDNIGVDAVTLVVTYPDGSIIQFTMETKSGKYVYENIYNVSGNYSYYIIATDKANNIKASKNQCFYITHNLDDADDDGMPDWWEERYGFNPFDSTDGTKDYDDDGLTNSEEYAGDTHPHKNIMLQNVAYRVRNNVLYIALSISMFVLLLILNFVVRKRR